MGKSDTAFTQKKKAEGRARKAATAEKKKQEELAAKRAEEDAEWEVGTKTKVSKRELEQEKKEEAARRKAERDAQLLAEQEENNGRPTNRKEFGHQKIMSRRG